MGLEDTVRHETAHVSSPQRHAGGCEQLLTAPGPSRGGRPRTPLPHLPGRRLSSGRGGKTTPGAASHFAVSIFPGGSSRPHDWKKWLSAPGTRQNHGGRVKPMCGLHPKPADSPDDARGTQGRGGPSPLGPAGCPRTGRHLLRPVGHNPKPVWEASGGLRESAGVSTRVPPSRSGMWPRNLHVQQAAVPVPPARSCIAMEAGLDGRPQPESCARHQTGWETDADRPAATQASLPLLPRFRLLCK